jgi:hypothetical protein
MFLETLAMNASTDMTNIMGGSLLAMFAGFVFVAFIISIGLYIYTSFAYMTIAKKAKQSSPGLAWIPVVGPAIIAFRSSKMHWWPWLILIGIFIPLISTYANLAFFIFFVVWRWRLMEEIKKPGWWSLLMIIPIVNLIMMGIAAWNKD